MMEAWFWSTLLKSTTIHWLLYVPLLCLKGEGTMVERHFFVTQCKFIFILLYVCILFIMWQSLWHHIMIFIYQIYLFLDAWHLYKSSFPSHTQWPTLRIYRSIGPRSTCYYLATIFVHCLGSVASLLATITLIGSNTCPTGWQALYMKNKIKVYVEYNKGYNIWMNKHLKA